MQNPEPQILNHGIMLIEYQSKVTPRISLPEHSSEIIPFAVFWDQFQINFLFSGIHLRPIPGKCSWTDHRNWF